MLQRIYEEPDSIDKKQIQKDKILVAIKKKKLGFSLGKNPNTGHNAGGAALNGGSVTLCQPNAKFFQKFEQEVPAILDLQPS